MAWKLFSSSMLVYTIACLVAAASAVASGVDSWSQSALTKSVALHGTVARYEWQVTAAPSEAALRAASTTPYLMYLSIKEHEALSDIQAVLQGVSGSAKPEPLAVEFRGPVTDVPDTVAYAVLVPSSVLEAGVDVQLAVVASLLHITSPRPREMPQGEQQLMYWEGDVVPRSPYTTSSAKVLVHAGDEIRSYEPEHLGAIVGQALVFELGAVVPPLDAQTRVVQQGSVHYAYGRPVASLTKYERHVEVSHWGDNMATEDHFALRNDGPRLKGHFSRAQYMLEKFRLTGQSTAAQIATLPLPLPGVAMDVYYVDVVGNVSTSTLAKSPPVAQMPRRLDVRPRYPLMGGWNYSFVVGWNERLSTSGLARVHPTHPSRTRIAVPFLMAPGNMAVDHAKLRVVLPEGATDIQVTLPFHVDSMTTDVYPTYLDSTGRPSVVLERSRCTSAQAQYVYIDYTLSVAAHLRKPLVVACVTLLLFAVAAFVRRQFVPIKAVKVA